MTLAFYSNAHAQSAKTASLEQHCDDIKMVFDVMKFNGDYKARAYAWIKGKCKGSVPLPALSDPHNVGWFNTAAGILQSGGGISIAPD
jgi:hypothetical protein